MHRLLRARIRDIPSHRTVDLSRQRHPVLYSLLMINRSAGGGHNSGCYTRKAVVTLFPMGPRMSWTSDIRVRPTDAISARPSRGATNVSKILRESNRGRKRKRKDLTLQRAGILICRSGLENWRLKRGLMSKLFCRHFVHSPAYGCPLSLANTGCAVRWALAVSADFRAKMVLQDFRESVRCQIEMFPKIVLVILLVVLLIKFVWTI